MTFGVDTYADRESIRTGRLAAGLRCMAQNIVHRLDTPRGMLRGGQDERDYGIDLPGLIGSTQNGQDAAALPVKISNELRKDRRVVRVVSTVNETHDGVAVSWDVSITVHAAEGSFSIAASAVDLEIVGLST